jgi:hypothetical protein
MTHEDAVRWAETVRSTRYLLREQLGAGQYDLVALVELAKRDPLVAQVKLLWALESFPGARKVDTRRLLAKLEVPESLRLNRLSQESMQSLQAEFVPLRHAAVSR